MTGAALRPRWRLAVHAFTGSLALALLILTTGCGADPNVRVTADRLDVRVDVRADGAIDVREEIAFRAVGDPVSVFERDVRSDEADGFSFTGSSIDGIELTPGATGDRTIAVRDGSALRLRWTFPAAPLGADGGHLIVLRYRVAGAMSVQGAHGHLDWPAISGGHAYPIALSHIVLALPAGATAYDPSGINEPGWTVARRDDGLSAERRSMAPKVGATLQAEFSIEPGVAAEPEWQFSQELSEELWPAWASGGIFILIIGVSVLWILRLQHPRALVVSASDAAAANTGDVIHDRPHIARALRAAGWWCVAIAAVTAAVCAIYVSRQGVWLQAIPASVLIDGVMFFIASRRY